MKLQNDSQTLIKSKPVETADYFIDPKNTIHVTQILQGMYKDPILAVIREYSANAVDAHTQAGIPERPIEVWLPTQSNPTFRVRDYGNGLSIDDAKKLLLGYGSSGDHKRGSNDFIGGFGIGGKCALAVADQFTYTIWHGGQKQIWTSYKGAMNESKADLVHLEPCDPNETGVEVSVPTSDISTFVERVKKAYALYPVQPIVHNMPAGSAMMKQVYYSTGWQVGELKYELVDNVSDSPISSLTLEMGGIGYPIDLESVYNDADNDLPVSARLALVIHAPVGHVQLAPSRETLQYSQFTKSRIREMMAMFSAVIIKDTVIDLLERTPTWLEKTKIWSYLSGCIYGPNNLEQLVESKFPGLSRHGVTLPINNLQGLDRLAVVNGYADRGYRVNNRYLCNSTEVDSAEDLTGSRITSQITIDTSRREIFVVKTSKPFDKRNVFWSMWKKLELETTRNNRVVVVVLQGDKTSLDLYTQHVPWLSEIAADHVFDDAWIEVAPQGAQFLRQHFTSRGIPKARSSSGGNSTWTKQPGTVVVRFRKDSQFNAEPSSTYWESVKAKSDELNGSPYVVLDAFRPVDECLHRSNNTLKKITNSLLMDGVTLYGLRRSNAEPLAKKHNLVPLVDWLKAKTVKVTESFSADQMDLLYLMCNGFGYTTHCYDSDRFGSYFVPDLFSKWFQDNILKQKLSSVMPTEYVASSAYRVAESLTKYSDSYDIDMLNLLRAAWEINQHKKGVYDRFKGEQLQVLKTVVSISNLYHTDSRMFSGLANFKEGRKFLPSFIQTIFVRLQQRVNGFAELVALEACLRGQQFDDAFVLRDYVVAKMQQNKKEEEK